MRSVIWYICPYKSKGGVQAEIGLYPYKDPLVLLYIAAL